MPSLHLRTFTASLPTIWMTSMSDQAVSPSKIVCTTWPASMASSFCSSGAAPSPASGALPLAAAGPAAAGGPVRCCTSAAMTRCSCMMALRPRPRIRATALDGTSRTRTPWHSSGSLSASMFREESTAAMARSDRSAASRSSGSAGTAGPIQASPWGVARLWRLASSRLSSLPSASRTRHAPSPPPPRSAIRPTRPFRRRSGRFSSPTTVTWTPGRTGRGKAGIDTATSVSTCHCFPSERFQSPSALSGVKPP
mmetsp:Transcript_62384/g.177173  ORF Transcript_62384/g.177173 Transcript_62384/m.177173 type:complete len:253 (-) Transcript_62384:1120-1878(-)